MKGYLSLRRLRWAIILSVWLIAGTVLYNWPSRAPALPAPRARLAVDGPVKPRVAGSQSELRGAVLIEQTLTSPAWKVIADQATLYDQTQTATARGVKAQLFQDREAVLSLNADEGNVSQANGDITVHGHVSVHHRDGYTIKTEVLDWQASSRTLETDQPVEIDGPSARITGTGLRSEVGEHRFSLQRDVQASFQMQLGQLHSDRTPTDAD